jgi:F-type H+-transporting ATPase subunit gamma
MAKPRIIVKRRKSVRNIRKITRTMQLIATARFQAAYNRAMATKPYAERLAELAADLSDAVQGEVSHPLMRAATKPGAARNPEAKRAALVVITTKRGLCGGYNTNVLRHALAHLREAEGRGVETDVYMVGKKGINYFRFLRREMRERITDISDSPRFNQVEPIANGLMDRFTRGEFGSVHVAYMRFLSTARQAAEVVQLLPLSSETKANGGASARRGEVQYEFSPDPKELLAELLPATVRIRLFQCFTDATVSEQVSRMVAMKAATDAAAEMITALTRQYNRARQTQITMELLDIVGGANALA